MQSGLSRTIVKCMRKYLTVYSSLCCMKCCIKLTDKFTNLMCQQLHQNTNHQKQYIHKGTQTDIVTPLGRSKPSLNIQTIFYNKELNFSITEQFFSLEHKLLPVLLTWLHLVYGKILFSTRHPHLMVYVENYSI